ncbi:MAG: gliding motility-associated C-terminal domain-containing protein [Bacteroidales bacterium]|nr:gliding motility-associated C-terminal domain-containing protein [Bacteroidales bacterium]
MKTGSIKILFVVLLCMFAVGSFAQQTITMNSNQTVNMTGCSAILYDSGGPNGNYSSYEDYTVTVCVPSNYPMELDVTMTTESTTWDYMYIYEGTNTNGNLVASRIGSSSSGTQVTHHYSLSSSCATFTWHTDGSGQYAGFAIEISCGMECQDFTLVPDITARWNATEERYEACSNDDLGIAAHGVFPNNDAPQGYHQSDENLDWTWSWVDVNGRHEDSGEGHNVLTADIEPGAYYINLQATDINGCTYIYPESFLVVISLPPTFNGTTATPDTICIGEIIRLDGHVQQPDEWVMQIPEAIVEEHCFEDVTNYVQTMCFDHNAFAQGQTIQSASDIESICMEIEHSYIGDLEVWITCPSGNRMDLFNGYGSACSDCGWEFLGEPVDEGGDACIQGTPYHYCWNQTATQTIESVASNPPTYTYTNNVGYTYTDHPYIPGGDYRPIGNWSSLVGCPVNGEWCINIQDHLGSDDGTVFSVELHFADHMIPAGDNVISYQTEFDVSETSQDLTWEGESVAQDHVALTTAMPAVPGDHEYTFFATDNFGCTYDTTLIITVRAHDDAHCCVQPTPYAGVDARVCTDRYMLSATPLPAGNEGTWTVVSAPAGGSATFAAEHSPTTNVFVGTWGLYKFRWTEAYLGDYDNCSTYDDVIVEFYPQPTNTFAYLPISCYGDATTITYFGNMTTAGPVGNNAQYFWDFDGAIVESGSGVGPYVIHWQDPEAATHPVSLHIEANGCVSEDTVVNIFAPSKLTGDISTIDNTCYRDCRGSATISATGGTLPYSYSWSAPSNTLLNLCVGEYHVTLSDANGCELAFDYEINEPDELVVVDNQTYSNDLSCYRSYDGSARILVTGGTGSLSYLWSDIGYANNRRNNLAAGVYVVTVADEHGCSLSREFIINQPDPLIVSTDGNSAVCEGTTSFVQSSAIGGTMPYTFHWITSNGSDVGNTPNFEATLHETTTYSVYVTDSHNCQSNTETFTITVSPEMVIDSMILVHNTCFGSCDGSAEIVMHGGLQPFQYMWGSENYIYRGLCAGLYTVTVVDNIGCNVNTYFIIEEPSQLFSNTMSTAASCGNTADGTALINVQGGVPPYSYLWPNGETTHNITAVPGDYVVTVSDDHDCRIESTITIDGPTPIYILPMSDQTICNGQTTNITTQAAGGTPFYTYVWANQDSVISYSNILTVTPTVNSTYTLTVTDAAGCTAVSQPVTVTLNPPLNIRAVTTSYDTICPGTGALINVESEGGNGGPYQLTIDNGIIVPAPFTITLDTTTMVHITLSDMCGTTPVEDSILINVRPKPDTLFTASEIAGCAPFAVKFTPFNTATQTLWEFGDYAFSDAWNPTHVYSGEGSYNVSLELVDNFGCHFYKTYHNMITVYPKPKALFETDPLITGMLDSEIEFINYSTGAERYYWFFGDNDSSLFENPRHKYRKIGEFEVMLIAESDNYCRDTTVRSIIIQNEFAFYAPTSFTPNGDAVNDCFRICGNGITRNNYILTVFDRWGAIVFRTDTYDPSASCEACGEGAWDGTDWGNKIKGDAVCPPGLYQWFCTFEDWNGVIHNRQGTVMLIR